MSEGHDSGQQLAAGRARAISAAAESYSRIDSRLALAIPIEMMNRSTEELTNYAREGQQPLQTHRKLTDPDAIRRVLDNAGLNEQERRSARVYVRVQEQIPNIITDAAGRTHNTLVSTTQYIISDGPQSPPKAVIQESRFTDDNRDSPALIAKSSITVRGRPGPGESQTIRVNVDYPPLASDPTRGLSGLAVNKVMVVQEDSVSLRTFRVRDRKVSSVAEKLDKGELLELGGQWPSGQQRKREDREVNQAAGPNAGGPVERLGQLLQVPVREGMIGGKEMVELHFSASSSEKDVDAVADKFAGIRTKAGLTREELGIGGPFEVRENGKGHYYLAFPKENITDEVLRRLRPHADELRNAIPGAAQSQNEKGSVSMTGRLPSGEEASLPDTPNRTAAAVEPAGPDATLSALAAFHSGHPSGLQLAAVDASHTASFQHGLAGGPGRSQGGQGLA
jgi:hypothetical protein